MVSKIMIFVVALIMSLLLIGIGLQYYISQPIVHDELVCHKGKLLIQVGGDGTVYTRVKEFTCDYEKGMLIIEEKK